MSVVRSLWHGPAWVIGSTMVILGGFTAVLGMTLIVVGGMITPKPDNDLRIKDYFET